MIIKNIDPKENYLLELKSLLKLRLTVRQRFLIEREIHSIQLGLSGEKDSAYYINFYYGDSRRWAVIHDLRIEYNNKIVQIDHILINRIFDIYVIESKNSHYPIKITDNGEFLIKFKKEYIGIPSPIEQNKRHIELLSKFIKDHKLMPKRFGIRLTPNFYNLVLVSPRTVIIRPRSKRNDLSCLIKADSLTTAIEKNVDEREFLQDLSSLPNISSFSTIIDFSKKLVSHHKPAHPDWKKKFGIKDSQLTKYKEKYYCSRCKSQISYKEARFCWSNKKIFKGRAYCYKCQMLFNTKQ